MNPEYDRFFTLYADLIVQVALNVQPGQRVMMIGGLTSMGLALETAPLVRRIAAGAYRAGARHVEVLWGDDELKLLRFQHAPHEAFREFPDFLVQGILDYQDKGDAVVSISSTDPDLLRGQDPEKVGLATQTAWEHAAPLLGNITRNATNWAVVAAAVPGWARRVFPHEGPEEATNRLWEAIFDICRLTQPDPVAAWKAHIAALQARSAYLNAKNYKGLHYRGTGTDLTIGLPAGHIWKSARFESQHGIPFTANVPTEEVFTLPDRTRIDGVVRSTKPLAYAGNVIHEFALRFAGGKVVEIHSQDGADILKKMINTDAGASSLGEVALVPHRSPISQSGLLFHNTLFDENAASHLALGMAYKFTLQGGTAMSDAEFQAAGGNSSLIHVDFMMGDDSIDIDGLTAGGGSEPVMRGGEWAFDL